MAALAALLVWASAAAAEEPIKAKLATVAPEGTPWADQLTRLKRRVESESGGRLKVQTFTGGALGDELGTAAECRNGTLQLWGGSTAALADLVPELALLELPYLFRDEAEADWVLDVVLLEDLRAKLAERGFVLLFWAENGYRSFGTRFGPVRAADALRGRRMRSQEAETHLEMYRALGATPVPIPVTEVIASLNTGAIDGYDNTPLFAQAASWYKGITTFTVTNHVYQPGVVVASKRWFDALPPELQKALLGDPAKEANDVRRAVRALTPLLLKNFESAGIEVVTPTAEERAALARATEPAHAAWLAGKGKPARALVEKTKKALASRRAGGK